MARWRSRAALLGLALMLVGGVVGYRVAMASLGETAAVAHERRAAPAPMQASLLGEAAPTAKTAPSAGGDLPTSRGCGKFRTPSRARGGRGWRKGRPRWRRRRSAPRTRRRAGRPRGPERVCGPADRGGCTHHERGRRAVASAIRPAPTPTAPPAQPRRWSPPTTPLAIPDPPAPPTIIAVDDDGYQELRVVMYSASWCGACQKAKAWMTAYSIPFEERDIEAVPEYAQQLRWLNPRNVIPTFDVDGSVMVGFDPRRLVVVLRRAVLRRVQAGALSELRGVTAAAHRSRAPGQRVVRSIGHRARRGARRSPARQRQDDLEPRPISGCPRPDGGIPGQRELRAPAQKRLHRHFADVARPPVDAGR